MTAYDLLHSFLDYEFLLLYCDRLGSDLRIGHFVSFRCLLINTPQLYVPLNFLPTESRLTHSLRVRAGVTYFTTDDKPLEAQDHKFYFPTVHLRL
jgi:hypothetical protein